MQTVLRFETTTTNRDPQRVTTRIKSPLNYIGGKNKLLEQLIPFFPKDINRFVDLFAGGFSVGINVDAKTTYLNDNLTFLVQMYRAFQEHSTEYVLKHIDERIDKFKLSLTNKEGYLALRRHYNEKREPLDLFVLVAYSFNHQIRFNSSHEFNNPFGANRSSFNESMRKNLAAFLNRLHERHVIISDALFNEFDFSELKRGDYVYCDPPYLITTGTYNDGKRGFTGWTETEERMLLDLLDELHKNGILFGLSNVFEHKGRENKLLKDWCEKRPQYKVNYLNYHYANSNYQTRVRDRASSIEVLITNHQS